MPTPRDDEYFRALVEHSHDMVVALDDDARIEWVSPQVSTLFGFDPADLVGTFVLDFLHPDDVGLAAANLETTLAGDRPPDPTLVRVLHANGDWLWTEVVGATFDDPSLHPMRVALYVRDVTHREEAERRRRAEHEAATEALRLSEARFRALLRHATDAVVVIGADGSLQQVNPERGLYGPRPAEEVIGLDVFEWIHPDEAETVRDTLAHLATNPGARVTRTFRAKGVAAEWRWVEATATNMLDDPDVQGIVVNYGDVTDRVEAERDAQRLLEVLEATEDIIGVCDPSGSVLHLNRAGRAFAATGDNVRSMQVPGRWMVKADQGRILAEVISTLERQGSWSGELTLVDAADEHVPVLVRMLAHRDPNGEVEFYSWIVREIAERKALEAELERRANHDELTGLVNRSSLLEQLSAKLAGARSLASTVAVLFIDLDHFKELNDRRGHAVGDDALRHVADSLRHAVRPGDLVTRFGGDEFVVVLGDVHEPAPAIEVAERILEVVAAPIVLDGEKVSMGASIGIAIAQVGDSEPAQLLRAADRAMYRAKAQGRNQVALADQA